MDNHQKPDYENRVKKDLACKDTNYDIFRKFHETSIGPTPDYLKTKEKWILQVPENPKSFTNLI